MQRTEYHAAGGRLAWQGLNQLWNCTVLGLEVSWNPRGKTETDVHITISKRSGPSMPGLNIKPDYRNTASGELDKFWIGSGCSQLHWEGTGYTHCWISLGTHEDLQ
jgi:hypothetical protein